MTREEAIKHLAHLQTIGTLSDETMSAFALAEEALKNESALLDRILEIIDELNDTKALADKTPLGHHIHKTLANEIKQAVLALREGGEQE